ncbi:uncharacterized protein [Periplaneta americana]|uniref:uncharacterized protein n=1 Tax=Periplaneta americana TaxID=6978 RepID=UPI0037E95F85
MDVILQRHGAKRVYPVPEGLRELCTDISREVLRSQPTNMYQFIADYLDALLHTRETARVAARILSGILDQTVTYEAEWKLRGLTTDEVTNAATVIQAAFRGYITRKSLKLRPRPPAIYDIIAKCGVDTETAVRACTIIQSAIRGYQARKTYEAHKVKKETKETEAYLDKILLDMNVTWDEANAAATRIQRMFRKGRSTPEVQEKPPGEPQEGKRYLLSLLETKDTVEASAGPFGLTQEEVTQFAEDIVDSIVFEASRSDAEEAVEVAGSIVDTLVINAAVYKPDKTNISEDESEDYSKSRKMEEEKEERMSGRDSITS